MGNTRCRMRFQLKRHPHNGRFRMITTIQFKRSFSPDTSRLSPAVCKTDCLVLHGVYTMCMHGYCRPFSLKSLMWAAELIQAPRSYFHQIHQILITLLLIIFCRKASCEQGTQLKAVRRHQCDLANGAFDYEQHGSNELIADHSEAFSEDQQQSRHQFATEQQPNVQLQSNPEVQPSNFNETSNGQSLISKDEDGQLQKSGVEECRTKQYELMKYQLLQKGNWSFVVFCLRKFYKKEWF